MSPEVKEADNSLLYAEKAALMKPCDWTDTWGKYKEVDVEIEAWNPDFARIQFMRQYARLCLSLQ